MSALPEPVPVRPRPPAAIVVRWCPVCGRDDRRKHLPRRTPHRRPSGRTCPGGIIEIRYVPEPGP